MMPAQKPFRSRQNYETPWAFIDAVEKRFGPMTFDLAAQEGTCKVRGDASAFFGPDGGRERDSLDADWTKLSGNLWLNPPFANIEYWAAKCDASWTTERRIFLLVPASVGTNWHAKHVDGRALVLFLRPRLCFDGVAPFPKDLMLAVYGLTPGYECWDWAERRPKAGPGIKKVNPARSLAARRAAERRQQEEDRVTQNIDPDHLALWRRVRRQFQTGAAHDRFEAFMQYVEEHPDEAIEAQTEEAAAKHLEWELEQLRGPMP